MSVLDREAIHSGDGVVSRHEPVQQHPEAVDIGCRRRRASIEQLRRQVERRSRHFERAIEPGELRAGAEVHEDRPPTLFAHDVLRFDVTMHEPAAVNRSQGFAQIEADEGGFLAAQRTACLQFLLQRAAVDELHPQAVAAIRSLDAVDRRRRWRVRSWRGAIPRAVRGWTVRRRSPA